MKKILKIAVLLIFGAFIGIQFVRPERANPPIDPKMTLEAVTNVPASVQPILKRSCNDCHSNASDYPWYSNVAPISWKVVEHIREGRKELNFSEWGTYSVKKQDHKLDEICEQVETGEMPHNQYLWIHWDAALSDADKKALCDWTKSVRATLKQRSEK
ncbi:MAG: heme-binding domain-containing protein [Acidobacteria bacterium]|nr:heme-binding domain-containing protein [Acidobacteriota bacterium]